MRVTRNAQCSIFDFYTEHPLGDQLKALSDLIDSQPYLLNLIAQDFYSPDKEKTGACGLTVESAFRGLLLKQILQVSYEKLSFHLSRTTNRTPTLVGVTIFP